MMTKISFTYSKVSLVSLIQFKSVSLYRIPPLERYEHSKSGTTFRNIVKDKDKELVMERRETKVVGAEDDGPPPLE